MDAMRVQDPEILENIDNLEHRLISYEGGLSKGKDDTALVQYIFRYAHNLKSSFGMLGLMDASKLIHHVESCFDLVRNAQRRASPALTRVALEVIDKLRTYLGTPETEPFPDVSKEVAALDAFVHEEAEADLKVDFPFPFDLEKAGRCKEVLRAGYSLYLVERLVSTNLDEAFFLSLPVFEQCSAAGELLAFWPRFNEMPRHGTETVLQLIIASKLAPAQLSKALGGPYRPVAVPEISRLYLKGHIAPDAAEFLESLGYTAVDNDTVSGRHILVTGIGPESLTFLEAGRKTRRMVLALGVHTAPLPVVLLALDLGADAVALSIHQMKQELNYLESLFYTGLGGVSASKEDIP